MNLTIQSYEVNNDLVEGKCTTSSCIYSYLNDYRITAEEASRGSCSSSKQESDDYTTATYENYR
jgi:hypothetical protein